MEEDSGVAALGVVLVEVGVVLVEVMVILAEETLEVGALGVGEREGIGEHELSLISY